MAPMRVLAVAALALAALAGCGLGGPTEGTVVAKEYHHGYVYLVGKTPVYQPERYLLDIRDAKGDTDYAKVDPATYGACHIGDHWTKEGGCST